MKISTKNALLLAVCWSALLVAGCGAGDTAKTSAAEVKTQCINGVEYYMFTESAPYMLAGFMAPKYNMDGTVALCN